ncbi:TniB family NTP-binding protein [Streptomyces sp. NPDC051956]|uniref:TniB family NTP-binding protein n=1 Tax=Streptomyces sp. NPDC051956 TaxID=3365677 RepID=UPI0037D840F1
MHELRVRQRFPDHDRIPVVYVSAPPNGSPRKLATRFAHFLGLPLKSRHNEMDIADTVCQILTDARCDLVCVDEIHNINMATSTGKDMSDHLKSSLSTSSPRSSMWASTSNGRACSVG